MTIQIINLNIEETALPKKLGIKKGTAHTFAIPFLKISHLLLIF